MRIQVNHLTSMMILYLIGIFTYWSYSLSIKRYKTIYFLLFYFIYTLLPHIHQVRIAHHSIVVLQMIDTNLNNIQYVTCTWRRWQQCHGFVCDSSIFNTCINTKDILPFVLSYSNSNVFRWNHTDQPLSSPPSLPSTSPPPTSTSPL